MKDYYHKQQSNDTFYQ